MLDAISKNDHAIAVMRNTGDSPWNAACVEGDEAVDEKCRQDTEQLSGF